VEVADLIAKLSAVNTVPYPVTYPVRKSVLTYYDATRSFVPPSSPAMPSPTEARSQMPWTFHQGKTFYADHFMELRERLIVWLPYIHHHWMHALRIPLGRFRVGSHRLRVDAEHQLNRHSLLNIANLRQGENEIIINAELHI